MIPYRIGDPITLRLGDRVLNGRVAGVSAQHVELNFPLGAWQGGLMGVLGWPDGMAQAIELAALSPQNELTLKLPIADLPKIVRTPAPPVAPIPEPVATAVDHVEMRRSVRVSADFGLYVVDPLLGDHEVAATAQDVSSGGLRLTCESALSVGREYLLRLPGGDAPLEVRARALRRLGPNVYALKFLGDREVGHRVMSMLFARVRGEQTPLKPRLRNFRRT